jgi:hypothetical protein
MTVTTRPPAPGAGVIEDARARQRSHRRAVATVALAAIAVAAWLGFSGGGGGAGRPAGRGERPSTPLGAPAARGPVRIATRALPRSVSFFTIERDGRLLLLSGSEDSGDTCVWVLLAPRTLRTVATLRSSCATPATAAEPFVPLDVEHRDLTATVYVARPDRDPRRVVRGPALMRHSEVSDTHLAYAYGAGLLWIYDVAALAPGAAARHQARRNPHAEVVEVSLRTGRPVRTVRMPQLSRPFVIADADGLWIVPSPETAGAGPSSTYLLAPGAGAPRVVRRFGDAAVWAVASGHTLWEAVRSLRAGVLRETLWRLEGARGAARRLGPVGELTADPTFESGTRTLWALDSPSDPGSINTCTRQQVVAIDGASGAERVVARPVLPGSPCFPVPTNQPYGGSGLGEAFAFGAFYFIDAGPFGSGAATLYRVRP